MKTLNILLILILILLIPATTRAKDYNILTRTDVKSSSFLPNTWKEYYGKNLQIAEIPQSELPKIAKVLSAFKNHYPPDLLRETLKSVHLVGKYRIGVMVFSGTYFNNIIVLKSSGSRYTRSYLTRIMHHEYSSILLDFKVFPRLAWKSASGKYGKHGSDEYFLANSGNARQEDVKFFKDGFLTYYGTTSFMEDVNTYAEYLFMDRKRLKEISQSNPKVKTKTKLIIHFYCGLHRDMKKYMNCDI